MTKSKVVTVEDAKHDLQNAKAALAMLRTGKLKLQAAAQREKAEAFAAGRKVEKDEGATADLRRLAAQIHEAKTEVLFCRAVVTQARVDAAAASK